MRAPVDLAHLVSVGLNVESLPAMREFYVRCWGLSVVTESPRGTYLRGQGDVPYCWSLHAGARGVRHSSWEISQSNDLREIERWLQQSGATIVQAAHPSEAPGVDRSMIFRDPEGNEIELLQGVHRTTPPLPVDASARPLGLSHVVYFADDVEAQTKFYEALGFQTSEKLGIFLAFLRCDANHHSLGFQRAGHAGVQHVAFEMRDSAELMQGVLSLGDRGAKRVWGPGRHQSGHNLFSYYQDPERNIVEYTAELEQLPDHAETVENLESVPDLWGSFPPVEMVG